MANLPKTQTPHLCCPTGHTSQHLWSLEAAPAHLCPPVVPSRTPLPRGPLPTATWSLPAAAYGLPTAITVTAEGTKNPLPAAVRANACNKTRPNTEDSPAEVNETLQALTLLADQVVAVELDLDQFLGPGYISSFFT
ncbi:hypothetical protein V6N11_073019 [Hibiscus sabdariffa]|uniref:Uncharacterized protein n=1 Tax=Hibiscus sabdariffa TaxID=183260 RepID=A0ABR2NX57_9ROSI